MEELTAGRHVFGRPCIGTTHGGWWTCSEFIARDTKSPATHKDSITEQVYSSDSHADSDTCDSMMEGAAFSLGRAVRPKLVSDWLHGSCIWFVFDGW
jgi:hypothetical protein